MKIKKHNIFLLLFIISYIAVSPFVFVEMYKNSGFGELFAASDKEDETHDEFEVVDNREENPDNITETPPESSSEEPTTPIENPTTQSDNFGESADTPDVTTDSSTEQWTSEDSPWQETTSVDSANDPITETTPEEPSETTSEQETTPSDNFGETTDTPEDETRVQFMTVEPSYFDDALFIGDSRTVGIYEYGVLKDADFFCNVGMSVYSVHKAEVNIPSVGKTTLTKLLETGKYGKVYIMLGMNELGYSLNKTISKYEELINEVRALQPDAVIYLQANLRVTKNRSESDSIYNNTKINRINSAVAAYANNKDIFYIDVNPLFDDGEGNFDKKYTNDNTHPFARYYTEWSKWLCEMVVIR